MLLLTSAINDDDKNAAPWLNTRSTGAPKALVHTSNNVQATLSNATSLTILSTMLNVASRLLLVWTGVTYMLKRTMHGLQQELDFRMAESESGKTGLQSGHEYYKSAQYTALRALLPPPYRT